MGLKAGGGAGRTAVGGDLAAAPAQGWAVMSVSTGRGRQASALCSPLWAGAGPLSAAWPGQAAVVCGHLSHGNTLSLSDGARVAPLQGTGTASDSPPARTRTSCLAGEGPDPQHLPVWWAAWPAMQWGCRAVSWGLVNRPGTSGPPLRVSQPPKPEIWALNQSLVLKHQLP